MAERKLCAIENCDKPAYVRGWCTTHYQRWRSTGDPLKGGWPHKTICEREGCDHKVFGRGLCSWHYKQGDFRPACSVDVCTAKVFSNGLCPQHYKRWYRHGDVTASKSAAYNLWLTEHKSFAGDECLVWPFARDKHGYGPSRRMCILAHGDPPTPQHDAAHSCGMGHLGCISPKHLHWVTHHENQLEMVAHGRSQQGVRHWNVKLTAEQVVEIRTQSLTATHAILADRFGVTRGTISDICRRRSWAWLA